MIVSSTTMLVPIPARPTPSTTSPSASGDPALAAPIRAKLHELLPAVASAVAPPDRGDTDSQALGASNDEVRNFALQALTRRLSIIGVPLSG